MVYGGFLGLYPPAAVPPRRRRQGSNHCGVRCVAPGGWPLAEPEPLQRPFLSQWDRPQPNWKGVNKSQELCMFPAAPGIWVKPTCSSKGHGPLWPGLLAAFLFLVFLGAQWQLCVTSLLLAVLASEAWSKQCSQHISPTRTPSMNTVSSSKHLFCAQEDNSMSTCLPVRGRPCL